eukprot:CCRYP_006083-RB/>CCRYP_006083-RB protein AED:0.19 eAED:0.39 QI:0/0/0/1/0/0/2/0/333
MTIHLPQHRVDRLWEILHSIPPTQKRTTVKKWHQVLGELRSMSIALPGARNMFARLQKALSLQTKNRVSLKKGVHQALEDFRWLASDLTSRPTRISELVPLLPGAEGQHDASAAGTGGVWFPGNSIPTRGTLKPGTPIVWRLEWPQFVRDNLVSSSNPHGTISNSDLELAGGLIHLDCVAQTLDTRERTLLSKGDNQNTTFWERKGSTTTDSAPAYLLRLFDCWLSSLDPSIKTCFCHNLRIAQETVTKGVSSSRAQKSISYYSHWIDFTTDLGLDPFLQAFSDKVPFLQVFGQRVRDGELACNKNSIKSRSVEDYIRAVAQAFLAMGPLTPA